MYGHRPGFIRDTDKLICLGVGSITLVLVYLIAFAAGLKMGERCVRFWAIDDMMMNSFYTIPVVLCQMDAK